jgi:hypothetical protein
VRRQSSLRALVPALALFVCLAPAAGAATLGVDRECYVAGQAVVLDGSGFAPLVSVPVLLGGQPTAAGQSDSSGSIHRQLVAPVLPAGLTEGQVEVDASDGTTPANAFLNVVVRGADFTPKTGDPHTLMVQQLISGFGLAQTRPAVYLHYVPPGYKPGATPGTASAATAASGTVRTRRLGIARGPCGVLRTSPRRLFPFKITPGTWTLQYDTNAKYTPGVSNSSFYWVARKLIVKS